MKITGIEYFVVDMPLKNPYTIAYETIDRVSNVFVMINTNSPIFGYGCAAPDLEVTGETADSVLKCLKDIVTPELTGRDPLRLSFLMERLKNDISDSPSALAAVWSSWARIPVGLRSIS